MLTIESTTWRNLMSYGDMQTTINFLDAKTTLIVGTNGAGKSTILDALAFGLYGRPYRDDISKGQLVNSINRKGLFVETKFKNSDNEYLVRRGTSSDSFEIYRNNELVAKPPAIAEYQKQLEEFIGMSFKTFKQIVVLGSAYTPFMKLSPSDRRAIVENILDIEVLTSMRKVLLDKRKEITERISALDADNRELTAKIQTHSSMTDSRVTELETEISEVETRISTDKSQHEPMLKQLQDKKADLTKNIDSAKAEVEELEQKVSHINSEISTANKEHDAVMVDKNAIESLSTEIINLKKEYEQVQSEICPAIAALEPVLKQQSEKVIALEHIEKTAEKDVNDHESQLTELRATSKTYQDILVKVDALTDDVANLSAAITEKTTVVAEKGTVEDTIKAIETELAAKNAQILSFTERNNSITTRQATIAERISSCMTRWKFYKNNQSCQECGTEMTEEHRATHIAKMVETAKELNAEKAALEKEAAEINSAIVSVTQTVTKLNADLRTLSNKQATITQVSNQLAVDIATKKSKTDSIAAILNGRDIGVVRKESDTVATKIADYEKKFIIPAKEAYQKVKDQLKTESKELSENTSKLAVLKTRVESLSGITSRIGGLDSQRTKLQQKHVGNINALCVLKTSNLSDGIIAETGYAHKATILTEEANTLKQTLAEKKSISTKLQMEFITVSSSLGSTLGKLDGIAVDEKRLLALKDTLKKTKTPSIDLEKWKTALTTTIKEYDVMIQQKEVQAISDGFLSDASIRAAIISSYIPTINEAINGYLELMNLPVSFTLDDELKEKVLSRYRDDFSYGSFSEGEKGRIDMALLLAWRKVAQRKSAMTCNLLILDEILDSSINMDGVDEIMSILRQERQGNVVIISHKLEMQNDPRIDKILSPHKDGEFSVLETIVL